MFKKPLWQTVCTQIRLLGAVCSGSTLFASILNSTVMLSKYLQQTTSADDIFRCIFHGALRVNKDFSLDPAIIPKHLNIKWSYPICTEFDKYVASTRNFDMHCIAIGEHLKLRQACAFAQSLQCYTVRILDVLSNNFCRNCMRKKQQEKKVTIYVGCSLLTKVECYIVTSVVS